MRGLSISQNHTQKTVLFVLPKDKEQIFLGGSLSLSISLSLYLSLSLSIYLSIYLPPVLVELTD